MPIKCDEYDQVCVMAITGDFVGDEIAAARRCVEKAIGEDHVVDIVLDVEKVPFIDSEGLETLLWIKRRVEDVFGQIKLIRPDDNFRKILEMTRLDHSIESHDDLESAVKTLR